MTRLTIATGSSAPSPSYLYTLASLPESFAAAGERTADVFWVEGSAGWAARAAGLIEAGAKALIIAAPQLADPAPVGRLLELVERHSIAVELAEPYAGDPALTQHGTALRDHLAALSALIVTENAPAPTPAGAALGIVRTLRALGRPIEPARIRAHGEAVFVNAGAEGLLVEGVVTRSRAGIGQRIQGIGLGRTLDVHLKGGDNARPAEILVTTLSGETRLPTIYETAERAAWKRLHRAVVSGRRDGAALRGFADDLDAVTALV